MRRVVSRDGTSQYYLNNARCRRKDITHILLGTGVGSHGYSIIEQGMISRLVEAKPEELRAFLEEAAGISKYKERRRETEHRIQHTRENLERLAGPARGDRKAAHAPAEAGEGRGALQEPQSRATQGQRRAACAAAEGAARRGRDAGARVHGEAARARSRHRGAALRRDVDREAARRARRPQRALQRRSGQLLQGRRRDRAARAVAAASQGSDPAAERGPRRAPISRSPRSTRTSRAIRSSSSSSSSVLSELGPGLEQAYAVQRASQQDSRARRARDGAGARAVGAHQRGARGRGALDSCRGHAARAARRAGPAAREGAAEAPRRARKR